MAKVKGGLLLVLMGRLLRPVAVEESCPDEIVDNASHGGGKWRKTGVTPQ